MPGVTATQVGNKWRNLKQGIVKYEDNKRSTGRSNLAKPKFYNLLTFLLGQPAVRPQNLQSSGFVEVGIPVPVVREPLLLGPLDEAGGSQTQPRPLSAPTDPIETQEQPVETQEQVEEQEWPTRPHPQPVAQQGQAQSPRPHAAPDEPQAQTLPAVHQDLPPVVEDVEAPPSPVADDPEPVGAGPNRNVLRTPGRRRIRPRSRQQIIDTKLGEIVREQRTFHQSVLEIQR